VARSELLEGILRAQFDLEYSEPNDLAAALERLNALLDKAIAGTHLTRRDLLSVLRDRYKEYKRAQLLADAQRRSV
jgi:transcription elongation factor GreA-like protein